MNNPIKDIKSLKSILLKEEERIASSIGLIASESVTPPWVRLCLDSAFHMRTVEGIVGQRYFPACELIDEVERNAEILFGNIFGYKYANVQPHCATTANIAALLSLAKPGDSILSLSTKSGGHVSHGVGKSLAARLFKVNHYTLNKDGELDYKEIEHLAKELQPQVIISGASCYSNLIKHEIFSNIADKINAYHLIDIAHTAGLICAGLLEEDICGADIVTFSTQKTLLGPRGGVVLTNNSELKESIDKLVFPGLQGALHNNNIAGKCACAIYAETEEFKNIMRKIINLAKTLAKTFKDEGVPIIGSCNENHQVILNLKKANKDTTILVNELAAIGIRANANFMPGDGPFPSGIRIGSTIIAQLGYSNEQAECIGKIISSLCRVFNENGNIKLEKREKCWLNELIAYNKDKYKRYVEAFEHDYDEYYSVYKNNTFAFSTIFRDLKKQDISIEEPITFYFNKSSIKIDQDIIFSSPLKDPKAAIIIPARDCPEYLNIVLQYIRNIAPRTLVVTCLSGKTIEEMSNIANGYNAVAIDSTRFVEWIANYCDIWGFDKEQLLLSRGKGLDMFSGVYYCYIKGVMNFYFMDSDFEDLTAYNPLLLLSGAKHRQPELDHILIATPNRKNDGLHNLIDNLDVIQTHKIPIFIDRVKLTLREIIHLLAGERYCSCRLLEQIPIATGYGIETIINIASSSDKYIVGQVENFMRPDEKNTREKNECMLSNCARFLLAIVSYGKFPENYEEEDIRAFNIKYQCYYDSTILPDRPGETVRLFNCRRDLIIPNIKLLKERFRINKYDAEDLVILE